LKQIIQIEIDIRKAPLLRDMVFCEYR